MFSFWFVLVVAILLLATTLEVLVSVFNLKALKTPLPREFRDLYDPRQYQDSQAYTIAGSKVAMIETLCSSAVTLVFFWVSGFGWLDELIRSLQLAEIASGLLYISCLVLISYLLHLPFGAYRTFVVEERFGFNKTTVATYVTDTLKVMALAILIGLPILGLILWFFANSGPLAWVYSWLGVSLVSFALQFVAPVLILPLFNRFTPLEPGPLRAQIEEYARQHNFALAGIFTMDGSKRSAKANAFFTGFGRFRKIVFFDTLLDTLEPKEIVAVLAHEMGHYRLHHVPKMMLISFLHTGLAFYLLSLVLHNQQLASAFGVSQVSTYTSVIFFAFLYPPVSLVLSILLHWISRQHEYQADHFAITSTGDPLSLIQGLKKLSRSHLSNLTPHPFKVLLSYSHPPLMARITAMKATSEATNS